MPKNLSIREFPLNPICTKFRLLRELGVKILSLFKLFKQKGLLKGANWHSEQH